MPTAGQVVRASDVVVQECSVNRTVAQSITDATTTTVAFDAEITDTDGMHSTSVNNSRITIQTAGVYSVGFVGSFAAAADYVRTSATILLNGTAGIARGQTPGTSTSAPQILWANRVYRFAVGDYIEVELFQDNTANAARNLEVVANRSPEFYAARIGS